MRRIVFFLIIAMSLISSPLKSFSQKDKPKKADIVKRLLKADSLELKTDTIKKTDIEVPTAPPLLDSEFIARNNRNLDEFLRVQKERNAKQKKAAMIRIGIGVAMLIVLVIGLARRRKSVK